MKHFNFFRGNSCFVAIMMLFVYCAMAFGQTFHYERTRYKNNTGRDEHTSYFTSWEFNGNNLIWHLENGMKLYWQFHHNDGSYAVYYRKVQNIQPGYGYGPSISNSLNVNDEIVVSSDRNAFCINYYSGGNISTRGTWKETYYYERREGSSAVNKPTERIVSSPTPSGGNYYNPSSRNNSSSTSRTNNTQKEYTCALCQGTGRVKRHISVGGFGINNPKTKCYECGEWMSDGCKHAHYSCSKCRGTGKLKY